MDERFMVSEEKSDKKSIKTQVITDEKTGVQYLLVLNTIYGSTGITPLLNADGTPVIRRR
ncbi:DUF6440 family protein [Enterococcus sp. AZ109]|uniref:DUF6440 family protein n=1 Tax=Enterococcus sp. AZ109 TaxID=2774634 RepID=UPI003F1E97FC